MSAIDHLRDLIGRHAAGRRTPTAVPGLMLFRSEGRSVPLNCIYRSRLYLIVQGSKRVELGQHAFTYDDSHYLITTVDLPVSSAVIEASPHRPYLALSIDFDPAVLADLLLSVPVGGDRGAGRKPVWPSHRSTRRCWIPCAVLSHCWIRQAIYRFLPRWCGRKSITAC